MIRKIFHQLAQFGKPFPEVNSLAYHIAGVIYSITFIFHHNNPEEEKESSEGNNQNKE